MILLAAAPVCAAVTGGDARDVQSPQKIVFQANVGGAAQIYIMNADGTGRGRLTDDTASNLAPAISPDGSMIAFVSDRDGTDHVYVMGIDGDTPRRLTDSPGAEGEPTWSPSGARIYFRKELGDGRVVLGTAGVDGGEFRQLTDGSIRYMRSALSPDGSSLLAVSVSRGFELFVMNRDGANPRRIPNAQGAAFASWSPDGTKIVYATATPPPNPTADIYVINADGSGRRRLTHGEGVSEYPCWSPDGREIAFQTSRDGNFEIYLMNADGSHLRRLTVHPGSDGRPSWGALGRH